MFTFFPVFFSLRWPGRPDPSSGFRPPGISPLDVFLSEYTHRLTPSSTILSWQAGGLLSFPGRSTTKTWFLSLLRADAEVHSLTPSDGAETFLLFLIRSSLSPFVLSGLMPTILTVWPVRSPFH